MHLGQVLGRFRGGNEALLPLLRSRFFELGLSLPTVPKVLDVTHESSGDSPGRVNSADNGIMPWVMDEPQPDDQDDAYTGDPLAF